MEKRYLGDGVYASVDAAHQIWLTTENGIEETNRVALEPTVLHAFMRFVEAWKRELSGDVENDERT